MSTTSGQHDTRASDAAYESGNGTPLVLLHGLGGNWAIWKPLLAPLAQHHRVLALTLPGHDGGPPLSGSDDARIAQLAEGVVAALKQRGIERAHFVGNSLGGWLALEMARRGHAQSVVALSPAGGWQNAADYRAIAIPFRLIFALMPLLLLLTRWLLCLPWLRRALGRKTMEHGERLSPGEFRASLRAMRRTTILPGLLRTMGRDGPIAPFSAGDVPIHIAWGSCDQVIPFDRYGASLQQTIAGARHSLIPGAGHVPMYDAPEALTTLILATTHSAEQGPAR